MGCRELSNCGPLAEKDNLRMDESLFPSLLFLSDTGRSTLLSTGACLVKFWNSFFSVNDESSLSRNFKNQE